MEDEVMGYGKCYVCDQPLLGDYIVGQWGGRCPKCNPAKQIAQLRADLASCREGRMKLQRVLADESQTRLYQERRADGAVEEMIESYKELTAALKRVGELEGVLGEAITDLSRLQDADYGDDTSDCFNDIARYKQALQGGEE